MTMRTDCHRQTARYLAAAIAALGQGAEITDEAALVASLAQECDRLEDQICRDADEGARLLQRTAQRLAAGGWEGNPMTCSVFNGISDGLVALKAKAEALRAMVRVAGGRDARDRFDESLEARRAADQAAAAAAEQSVIEAAQASKAVR
jgi:hypothetical protein